jgi:flagellar protein FliJ
MGQSVLAATHFTNASCHRGTEVDYPNASLTSVRVNVMKSRDSALRLKRFEVAEKARKFSDMEMMARDFEIMIVDLERQITVEEERTGVRDSQHFAYSTFAKSVAARRENLVNSVADLRLKLDAARREHDEALDELQRLEAAEANESATERGRNKPDSRGMAVG